MVVGSHTKSAAGKIGPTFWSFGSPEHGICWVQETGSMGTENGTNPISISIGGQRCSLKLQGHPNHKTTGELSDPCVTEKNTNIQILHIYIYITVIYVYVYIYIC